MGGQHHTPAALPPGKTRYPLYRRLGGPQGRSGRVRKISPPPEFDPRTVQPVASRYTNWTFPALHIHIFILILIFYLSVEHFCLPHTLLQQKSSHFFYICNRTKHCVVTVLYNNNILNDDGSVMPETCSSLIFLKIEMRIKLIFCAFVG